MPQIAVTMLRRTDDRPIVTMMIEMIGSPIMGRRIRRSTTSARESEKQSVRRNAQNQGILYWTTIEKQK